MTKNMQAMLAAAAKLELSDFESLGAQVRSLANPDPQVHRELCAWINRLASMVMIATLAADGRVRANGVRRNDVVWVAEEYCEHVQEQN